MYFLVFKDFFNQSHTRIDLETDPRSFTFLSISPVMLSAYVKIKFFIYSQADKI